MRDVTPGCVRPPARGFGADAQQVATFGPSHSIGPTRRVASPGCVRHPRVDIGLVARPGREPRAGLRVRLARPGARQCLTPPVGTQGEFRPRIDLGRRGKRPRRQAPFAFPAAVH